VRPRDFDGAHHLLHVCSARWCGSPEVMVPQCGIRVDDRRWKTTLTDGPLLSARRGRGRKGYCWASLSGRGRGPVRGEREGKG
jgi:hypothetical protein